MSRNNSIYQGVPLRHEDGRTATVGRSIKATARELDVSPQSLSRMLHGKKQSSVRGWRRADRVPARRYNRVRIIMAGPDGSVREFPSVKGAAQSLGICSTQLFALTQGVLRGWTVAEKPEHPDPSGGFEHVLWRGPDGDLHRFPDAPTMGRETGAHPGQLRTLVRGHVKGWSVIHLDRYGGFPSESEGGSLEDPPGELPT